MATAQNKLNIAVIVGSPREGSFNRKMAHALIKMTPDSLSMNLLDIRDLPIYNPDIDGDDAPDSWKKLRKQLRQADGFLFVTPEYNRSIPGILKNALDVGSRPYGENSWTDTPAAIVSVSPGQIGAFGANHHLRQALVFLNVLAMPQPEAYIGGAGSLFDDNDDIANEGTRDFMADFLTAFEGWAHKHQ